MFKQIFRLTVVTYVWKRYKAIIVSTVILFVFFWLVSQLHQDYLSYGELNGDKAHIGLSFVIKWGILIVGFIAYVLFNSWQGRQKTPPKPLSQSAVKPDALASNATGDEPNPNDPFDAIRKRKKLRSKADFIIEERPD
jgi:hypothetical protein